MLPRHPFFYISVPGLALIFGYLWLRRKKMCDLKKDKKKQQEYLLEKILTEEIVKHSNAIDIKGISNIIEACDNKLAKSAPIDIVSNGKISTVYLTNKETDLNILEAKTMEKNCKLSVIEENLESVLSVDLPGSAHNSFSFKKFESMIQKEEPVVIKATTNAKISPKDSFLENHYTEECTTNGIQEIENDNKHIISQLTDQVTASSPVSSCSMASTNSTKGGSESTDSGKGSSLPKFDAALTTYEFLLPNNYVGAIYGRRRSNINEIQSKSGVHITLRKDEELPKFKVCALAGTDKEINAAINLIREKLPIKKYPLLTLKRINVAPDEISSVVPLDTVNLQLRLVEGINNDVIISCIISGCHIFVQLPLHPSYYSLGNLQLALNEVYVDGNAPLVPDIVDFALCVGKILNDWYRIQIINKNIEEKICLVKTIDYGGYYNIPLDNIRQIRTDFLQIPFQAIECTLANLEPTDDGEWTTKAVQTLFSLTTGIVLQAQIVGYTSEGVPEIYLFARIGPNKNVFINKELVGRGLAKWNDQRTE